LDSSEFDFGAFAAISGSRFKCGHPGCG
jgi:hypothetical protein